MAAVSLVKTGWAGEPDTKHYYTGIQRQRCTCAFFPGFQQFNRERCHQCRSLAERGSDFELRETNAWLRSLLGG